MGRTVSSVRVFWLVHRQCPGKGNGSCRAGLLIEGSLVDSRLWGWPALGGLRTSFSYHTEQVPYSEGASPWGSFEGRVRGTIDLLGEGDVFRAFQGRLNSFY